MNRRLVHILAISLLLSLAGGHVVFAQKSRRRSASSSRIKKDTRSKRSASRRGGAVSRKGKRSRGEGRVSSRRRRGKVAARSRVRASRDAQEISSSAAAPQRIPGGIPTERIIEIQTALARMGYYEGPPSGQWDESTTEAMKQFQAASGLATTGLPSAFTLKKLGVSKTSGDGYSVPVKSVSQNDKRP